MHYNSKRYIWLITFLSQILPHMYSHYFNFTMVPGDKLRSQISRLAHSAKLVILAPFGVRAKSQYRRKFTLTKPVSRGHLYEQNEPKNKHL